MRAVERAAPAAAARAPAATGPLVARRCACGGIPGASGECEACRRRRLAGGRAGSGREPLRTPPPAAGRSSGLESTRQRIAEQREEESRDHLLSTEQKCNEFEGESRCNWRTGEYEILSIKDPCCTRECTEKHEEKHVDDLEPCCEALQEAIEDGADRERSIKRFNRWLESGALDWSECNAYRESVECGRELYDDEDCEDDPKTRCCRAVNNYIRAMSLQQEHYCREAPKELPKCPF